MLPAHILNALNGSLSYGNAITHTEKTDTAISARIKAIQAKNQLDLSINYAIGLHNQSVSAVNAIDDNDYSFEYHTCAPDEVLTLEA